jgi:hypothetical protein
MGVLAAHRLDQSFDSKTNGLDAGKLCMSTRGAKTTQPGWPVIQRAGRASIPATSTRGPLSARHPFESVIGTLVDECQYKEYHRVDLPDSAAAYRWLLRHESFVRPETSTQSGGYA